MNFGCCILHNSLFRSFISFSIGFMFFLRCCSLVCVPLFSYLPAYSSLIWGLFILITDLSYSLSFIFSHPWSLLSLYVTSISYWYSPCKFAIMLFIVRFLFISISNLPFAPSINNLYSSVLFCCMFLSASN